VGVDEEDDEGGRAVEGDEETHGTRTWVSLG